MEFSFDDLKVVVHRRREQPVVGPDDVLDGLRDLHVVRVHVLGAVEDLQARVRAVTDHELHHVQGVVQGRPHERGEASVVSDLDVRSRLNGRDDCRFVVLPGSVEEVGVHLLNRADGDAHLQVLARVVGHREARLVRDGEVQATRQEVLHQLQVPVPRRPHAGGAALVVRHEVVRLRLDQQRRHLLLTVDRGPDDGGPAVVVLGVQVRLLGDDVLGHLRVPSAAGEHQGVVALPAAGINLRLGLNQDLVEVDHAAVGREQEGRPAEDLIFDIHIDGWI
mmetsp:Transcript_57875/g.152370  ORF Transcript_57875/g.152370 Transcript_57875/m.152370 type:complete len:278 (+) Transcript_57875:1510-2343(+)